MLPLFTRLLVIGLVGLVNCQKNNTNYLDTVKKFVKCQLFTFMCQNQFFADCSFKCSLSGISMCEEVYGTRTKLQTALKS